jgi:hypothetical protein
MSHQQQRLDLAQQLGFRQEGCLREHFFHGGQLNDLVCLGWASRG